MKYSKANNKIWVFIMQDKQNRLILIALFIEGFVSVSLQVIFLRQLMPFVGNDIVMVGIIIGVFLAALSLSYIVGGNAIRGFSRLRVNFVLSALWLGVGSSYYVLDKSLGWFVGYGSPYLIGTVYLLIAMAPIVFALGQTLPILTGRLKLNKKDKEKNAISLVAGFSLSLNTVGSVFGAVFTPIVLFTVFGVGTTILISVCMLVFLSVLMVYIERADDSGAVSKYLKATALTGGVIIAFSVYLNVLAEKSEFIVTTSYANYKVSDQSDDLGNHSKVLELNRSFASILVNNETISYVNYFHKYLVNQLKMTEHDVLVMGAGGFTFSYNDNTNNRYTYVDIDSEVKAVAEKFFLETKVKGKFVADDARLYIKDKHEAFDVVFLDLYSNRFSMPWHLTTREFLQRVSESVKKEGYVFINSVHSMGFSTPTANRFDNTVRSVFDYCYSVPLIGDSMIYREYVNLAYVCKKPVEGSLKEMNVDDRNFVD